jgi:hypothetical protein
MSDAPRTAGRRGPLAAVAIGLAIQVVVAAWALTGERPGRYGWQMYSTAVEVPRLWAIHGDDEREVTVTETLVHPRGDIDWAALVRDQGCELVEADEIRYELPDGTRGSQRCR